ncbi:MAG: hypothetical protein ACTSWK_01990 [Promethearchaeota archaeon]
MKCPCKDCLLIPICNNRHSYRSTNFIKVLQRCSLLYQFLKVTKINTPTTEFWSNLDNEQLIKRLNETGKYIPFKCK